MAKTTDNSRHARYKSYAKDTYYHIYNRGNGKQNIFNSQADYLFYIGRLEQSLKKYDVELICYVLMPNHVHLVAKQKTDVPIYKFVSSLHTSYSIYFNKKYQHVGHLFQDRFKQVLVTSDEQLLYLTKYVHRNPVEAGLAKTPTDYPWSSYHEYLRILPLPLCEKNIILELLGAHKETFSLKYSEFCKDAIPDKEKPLVEDVVLETF